LQFTAQNTPYSSSGKIPNQTQINSFGSKLYQDNMELIKMIINMLKNGKDYKKFD
jgi:hypothetical protein